MNVILIGYRGSGKTTVGRTAAARLRWRFADSDAAVVARFGGRSIREIWEAEGEAAFRAAEVEVTRELVRGDRQVIALGGGTVMQPAARRAVEAADAMRFYLKASAAVLARRIAADAATAAARPSLTGAASSVEEVAAVLAAREPTYEAVADHVIDVEEASVEEAAARVVALVQEQGAG
jgi:shikimate kinase